MFGETSYPGYLGDLGGAAWQAVLQSGFTGTKAAWKQGGRQLPAGYVPPPTPTPSPVSTIPTTEPNQCPPGMSYSPPPPGSGTGSCTGSIVPGDGSGATGSSGGGIGDILASISPTVWLIIAGVALFVILKK
jgi:hypothetical protein